MSTQLEKWGNNIEAIRTINEFLEFINSKKILLSRFSSNDFMIGLTRSEIDELIASCFDVDLDELEKERRELLETARQNSVKVNQN